MAAAALAAAAFVVALAFLAPAALAAAALAPAAFVVALAFLAPAALAAAAFVLTDTSFAALAFLPGDCFFTGAGTPVAAGASPARLDAVAAARRRRLPDDGGATGATAGVSSATSGMARPWATCPS